jgi:hypothetical protein
VWVKNLNLCCLAHLIWRRTMLTNVEQFFFVYRDQGSLVCFHSESINLWNYECYRQLLGPLGRGISLLRGRYLHRTTQTQKKRRRLCFERDPNPRCQW